MRRPHVYDRSGPRPRPVGSVERADYGLAAQAALVALPDLLRQDKAVGAVALARYLGQALSEAEGIMRRGP